MGISLVHIFEFLGETLKEVITKWTQGSRNKVPTHTVMKNVYGLLTKPALCKQGYFEQQ